MAFNAQNIPGTFRPQTGPVDLSPQGTNTDLNTAGYCAGQTSYNTAGAQGQHVGERSADPDHVYHAPEAVKIVRHVYDPNPQIIYEEPTIIETIVHHDVEVIKPVVHREVHQTRQHEVAHHKAVAPQDLVGNDQYAPVAGQATSYGTTGGQYNNATSYGTTGGQYNNLGDGTTAAYRNNVGDGTTAGQYNAAPVGSANQATEYGTTGGQYQSAGEGTSGGQQYNNAAPVAGTAGNATGYGTTGANYNLHYGTNAYGNAANTGTTANTGTGPGGIKGLINKIIPGPGPFK